MQENIEFRVSAKIIGWVHFIASFFSFIHCVTLIGFYVFALVHTSTFDQVGKEQIIGNSILGLIYHILGGIFAGIGVRISMGLINGTDMDRDLSEALHLAKRWRIWFVVADVTCAGFSFVYVPFVPGLLLIIVSFGIEGVAFYLVHKYIQSLKRACNSFAPQETVFNGEFVVKAMEFC